METKAMDHIYTAISHTRQQPAETEAFGFPGEADVSTESSSNYI